MTLRGVGTIGLFLVCIGLTAVLIASMLVTTPAKLGPLGVTAWFMACWLILGADLAFAWYELGGKLGKGRSSYTERRAKINSVRVGLLTAGGLTVMLALSSLRQLDIRDIALISVLLLLVEFYIRTRS